jgi:predicted small secreted protein
MRKSWLIALLLVLAAITTAGCGPDVVDVASLLTKASDDVEAAKAIEASFGSAGTADVTRAQDLIDEANQNVTSARQQTLSASDTQQADTLTANAGGVQSAIDARQAAIEASSSAPAAWQDRIDNYVYKTATTKVCQEVSTALLGQTPTSPSAEQLYMIVSTDFGPSAPPNIVQLVAAHVAATVQAEVDRINAFLQANPNNATSILKGALAYYNCLPSTAGVGGS